MKTKDETKPIRLNIPLEPNLHADAKVKAAQRRQTLKDWVIQQIVNGVKSKD